jgi:hypothetical protein
MVTLLLLSVVDNEKNTRGFLTILMTMRMRQCDEVEGECKNGG